MTIALVCMRMHRRDYISHRGLIRGSDHACARVRVVFAYVVVVPSSNQGQSAIGIVSPFA